MRLYKGLQFAGMLCICSTVLMAHPFTAQADTAVQSSDRVMAEINQDNVSIYQDQNEKSDVVAQLSKGSSYNVLEDGSHGWVKVSTGDKTGYLELNGNATLAKATPAPAPTVTVDPSAALRQQVVDYALQLVGGRYRYGGTDPRTGVDCSGFTRLVLQNAAGVSLSRSSGSQAAQGKSVSAAQIQPGDLVFYGNGRHINHVALYIGNGQIVHASTERTGIKVSDWLYRSPIKIVSVLG